MGRTERQSGRGGLHRNRTLKPLQNFALSRINTRYGIFRIIGAGSASGCSPQIRCVSVEFMGTDGWCEMDITLPQTMTILTGIQPDILQHLGL